MTIIVVYYCLEEHWYLGIANYEIYSEDKSITCRIQGKDTMIYLINQARGPYRENIAPRSWQYGPSTARSVQKRRRADILPGRSRASLVNKTFITRLQLFRRKTQIIDCKDTINFKRAIFISSKLNVYSRLTFSKRRKTKLKEKNNKILCGVNTFRKKKK